MRKLISNIKGMEEYDKYAITSDGDVISYYGKEGRILKGRKGSDGYLSVYLSSKDKQKTFSIHRLVAKAFIEGYEKNLEVNHVDEDKFNNDYRNLEWITHRQNMNHGTRNVRISQPIIQLTLENEFVREWTSATEVERSEGYFQNNICNVCKGKRKSCGGFHWEYKE